MQSTYTKGRRHRYYCLFLILTVYALAQMTLYPEIEVEEKFVKNTGLRKKKWTNEIIAKNTSTKIFPLTFCKSPSFLVVIICSKPSNFKAREAIRSTWAKEKRPDVLSYFLLGKSDNVTDRKVEEESVRNGDVIQGDFLDTYYNLTAKSLAMLKLFTRHCMDSSTFLFKVDDDVYADFDLILSALKKFEKVTGLLLGRVVYNSPVVRDIRSKWYTPYFMFSKSSYPPILSGVSYIMSSDVAKKLYDVAFTTRYFHLEDVFLTGICAAKVGIKPRRLLGMMKSACGLCCNKCHYYDAKTVHPWTPKGILLLHEIRANAEYKKMCSSFYERVATKPRWPPRKEDTVKTPVQGENL